MQSEGTVFIRLIFSAITLILRSPFALPSVWLRSAFVTAIRCLGQCCWCNRLIVKELRFLDKEGGEGGDFCIIRKENEEISNF